MLYQKSERKESHRHFIFYCQLSKATLDFISQVIHLHYSFNIAFKVSLKAIIMGASSQFNNFVDLKILPILLEVFLSHLSYRRRKIFHDDGYGKINQLFNFNCNLLSPFNKLRDTATELGSKETFLKTSNYLLNKNRNHDIKMNQFSQRSS